VYITRIIVFHSNGTQTEFLPRTDPNVAEGPPALDIAGEFPAAERFFNERCLVNSYASLPVPLAKAAYKDWCKAHGEKSTCWDLRRYLIKRGYEIVNQCYQGIDLKQNFDSSTGPNEDIIFW